MACKIPDVSSLVKEAQDAFQAAFGATAQVTAVAPGRVNIIGEHTDYNDGFVFPMVSEARLVLPPNPIHSEGWMRFVRLALN